MFLGNIAERWVNEPLEAFDYSLDEFVPSDFVARISLTDRFLSNFNRPLRRRMLHYKPDALVPVSRVVRAPATGDVYLVGQARRDSDNSKAYHQMSVAHLVTDEGDNGSSGKAEIARHVTSGTEEDPGWATLQHIENAWCDIEFRTSLNEADLVDERIQAFIAWFSMACGLRVHDTIYLHGQEYTVTDTYPDSGLLMARIDRQPAFYVNTVFRVSQGTRYDQTLRRYVADSRDYQVTARLTAGHDYTTWSTESDDFILLAVNEDHIGFRPEAGMEVVYDGRVRTIRQVSYYRGERQYKIRCR